MIRVANHLEIEAKSRTDPDEKDYFARSAYNRYYYATFFIIRTTLGAIDPLWAEPAHSGVPDLLKKTVVKRIKTQLSKNLLTLGDQERLKNLMLDAANNLANLLQQAYLVRIQADYKPENRVVFEKSTFSLHKVKSSEAAYWPDCANRYSSQLLSVAKQVGLT